MTNDTDKTINTRERIQTVLSAGTGAIGLMLAGRIFESGKVSIKVLAEGERAARYKREGFFINGKKYDLPLSCDAKDFTADLIIVACKYYSLQTVIVDIKPFVHKDTIIVSLLNGITSEKIIGACYGNHRLPLSVTAGSDSMRVGTSITYNQIGSIYFGDAEDKPCVRDEKLKAFFTEANVPFVYLQTGAARKLWYKFMMNIGVNQTQALLDLPYGAFKKNTAAAIPQAMEIMEKAMREVILIANAEGIDLNDSDIEECYRTFSSLSDDSNTSMHQDIAAKRKTEKEIFGITVCEYGRKHKIPTPVNEMLVLAITALEEKNKR